MAKKLIAILGALLVSLGAASVWGLPPNPSEPGREAYARADAEEVSASQATADSSAPVLIGGMSKAEKKRRQDACVSDWESDMDWCKRTTKFGSEQWNICKKGANDRLADCMARID